MLYYIYNVKIGKIIKYYFLKYLFSNVTDGNGDDK